MVGDAEFTIPGGTAGAADAAPQASTPEGGAGKAREEVYKANSSDAGGGGMARTISVPMLLQQSAYTRSRVWTWKLFEDPSSSPGAFIISIFLFIYLKKQELQS